MNSSFVSLKERFTSDLMITSFFRFVIISCEMSIGFLNDTVGGTGFTGGNVSSGANDGAGTSGTSGFNSREAGVLAARPGFAGGGGAGTSDPECSGGDGGGKLMMDSDGGGGAAVPLAGSAGARGGAGGAGIVSVEPYNALQ